MTLDVAIAVEYKNYVYFCDNKEILQSLKIKNNEKNLNIDCFLARIFIRIL